MSRYRSTIERVSAERRAQLSPEAVTRELMKTFNPIGTYQPPSPHAPMSVRVGRDDVPTYAGKL